VDVSLGFCVFKPVVRTFWVTIISCFVGSCCGSGFARFRYSFSGSPGRIGGSLGFWCWAVRSLFISSWTAVTSCCTSFRLKASEYKCTPMAAIMLNHPRANMIFVRVQ